MPAAPSSASSSQEGVPSFEPTMPEPGEEEGEVVDVPQVRKRAPIDSESAGKSSVAPSTLARAAELSTNFSAIASDLGEATGSVAAHEVNSRFGRAAQAAIGDEKAQKEFLSNHAAAVQQGGQAGRQAGAAVGSGAGYVILAAAKRMGAHQCDNCKKQHLYNYFTCDAPECSHIDNQYDLCYECYAQFRSGAKIHPSSHTMSEHHNGLYTIKILGAIVAVLCILRFLMARVI